MGSLPLMSANGIDQRVAQDAPQPTGQFGLALPVKLFAFLVCLDQGLLDAVGRINLSAQVGIQLQPSQQVQIFPILVHTKLCG